MDSIGDIVFYRNDDQNARRIEDGYWLNLIFYYVKKY